MCWVPIMRSGSSNTWASPDSRIYIDLDNTLVINPMNKYVFPVVYREMSDHLGLEPDYVRRLLIKKHLEYIVKNPLLACLLYTSPSPRDLSTSRIPSSA